MNGMNAEPEWNESSVPDGMWDTMDGDGRNREPLQATVRPGPWIFPQDEAQDEPGDTVYQPKVSYIYPPSRFRTKPAFMQASSGTLRRENKRREKLAYVPVYPALDEQGEGRGARWLQHGWVWGLMSVAAIVLLMSGIFWLVGQFGGANAVFWDQWMSGR